jgi:hypothetical protein
MRAPQSLRPSGEQPTGLTFVFVADVAQIGIPLDFGNQKQSA